MLKLTLVQQRLQELEQEKPLVVQQLQMLLGHQHMLQADIQQTQTQLIRINTLITELTKLEQQIQTNGV